MPSKQKRIKLPIWHVRVTKKSEVNFKNIPYLKLIIITLLLNCLVILLIFFIRSHLPPQLSLLYGLPKSEDQLVKTLSLTIPNFTAGLILLLNLVISLILEEEFLHKTLIINSFIVTLLSSITVFKIIFLVGSF